MPRRWTRGLLCLGLWSACHLGRPQGAVSWQVAPVMAPVAQPGVGDDLGTALAQELAHRGALGGSASPELACRVLQADTAVAGAGAEGARFSRAHLSIEVVLAAAPARRVVLEATRSYAVDVGDPLGAAAEREAAFAGLAAELARDAVAWALMAPVREEEG